MASVLSARDINFSDIDFKLKKRSNGDLYRRTEVEAVKQSVINIITTNFGDRPFQPNFGANLRTLLFEPIDQISAKVIRSQIIEAIKNFEPRAEVLNVRVQDMGLSNSIQITVDFGVYNPNQEIASVGVILERLR